MSRKRSAVSPKARPGGPKKSEPWAWERYPQFVEPCSGCGHTQNFHIGTTADGRSLTGRMVPCRHAGCDCQDWVSTWR